MGTLHACIQDNVVVNVVIVDSQDTDIINTLKETFGYDHVVEAVDPLTAVDWVYDPILNVCVNPAQD